jgi:3-methyladenine DNA glycosylase/8-oxoguanine DNA glycosylase
MGMLAGIEGHMKNDGRVLTVEECERATRHLSSADPVLARLIAGHGACPLWTSRDEPVLNALARALVSQQLSVKAAETIYRRFLALFPDSRFPSPADILALSIEQMRAAGMSRPKAAYLRDLCARVQDGRLPLDDLEGMDDQEVISTLTEVKGIGQWTAEMILIFTLRRADILPVDDVGILRGIQTAYSLRRRPTPERVLRMGEKWRPYRSVASWYIWASLDGVPADPSP